MRPLAAIMSVVMLACGVTPAQHTANVSEGAQYGLELAICRAQGRAAKADGGGPEGYMQAYEACADLADRKHQVKP